MRKDRLAEGLLSLVAPADRASSTVGDLIEDAGTRGRFWFWRSIVRIACSWLGRDLVSAPLAMAASAMFAWFPYMGLSLLLSLAGYVVVTLAWGLAYVLAHHTGVELLADLLRVRFDWPPIPAGATYAIQAIVFFAAAPFQIGRISASYWRGHELSVAIVTLPIWLSMSVLAPVAGVGIRTTPATVPVLVAFLLVGLVSARPTRAAS